MLLLIIVNVLQIYILHVPRGVSSFILKKRICSYKWYIIISDSESSIHQMEGHFYYRKQTHKQVRVRRINTNQTLNKKTKLPFLDLDKRYCMIFVQMGSTWRNVKTDFIVHKLMYFEKLIRNEINSIYFVCRINLIKELGGAKKYELCSKLENKLLNVSVSCHVPFFGYRIYLHFIQTRGYRVLRQYKT